MIRDNFDGADMHQTNDAFENKIDVHPLLAAAIIAFIGIHFLIFTKFLSSEGVLCFALYYLVAFGVGSMVFILIFHSHLPYFKEFGDDLIDDVIIRKAAPTVYGLSVCLMLSGIVTFGGEVTATQTLTFGIAGILALLLYKFPKWYTWKIAIILLAILYGMALTNIKAVRPIGKLASVVYDTSSSIVNSIWTGLTGDSDNSSGSTTDKAKETAKSAKEKVETTAKKAKEAATSVKEAVVGATEKVKETTEKAKDVLKGTKEALVASPEQLDSLLRAKYPERYKEEEQPKKRQSTSTNKVDEIDW